MTGAPHGLDPDAEAPVVVRVDWFSFTVREASRSALERAVSEALGCGRDAWGDAGPRQRYEMSREGPCGSFIAFSRGRPDLHVRLPGKACGRADQESLRRLFAWAKANNGKPTRIDLAIDDMQERCGPRFVKEQFEGPTRRSRVKYSCLTVKSTRDGDRIGESLHLGSMSSTRCLNVYDKRLESQGQIQATRWELRSKDERACAVLDELVVRDDWGRVACEQLVDLVDFREESGNRCAWFADLVGDAEAARLVQEKPEPDISRMIAYVRKQVAPTLCVLMHFVRGDLGAFVELLGLEAARGRLSVKQQRVLRDVAREPLRVDVD